MMVHNNFGRDQFRVVPSKVNVWAVGQLSEAFEQIARACRVAGESPEMGRSLKCYTDHVTRGVRTLGVGF